MPIPVGVLSSAHVHAPSFTSSFQSNREAEVVGVWDDDPERGRAFAEKRGLAFFADMSGLLARCEAVVICSENMKHAALITAAAQAGLHVLCEKPIAPDQASHEAILAAWEGSSKVFMTAFPCPFSPSFRKMAKGIKEGEIGRTLALCATNRGSCPGGWFVQPELSGGGAMIDHVVHVADLLRRLLGEDPDSVYAQIGRQMYGQDWEDTAKVSLGYPSGVFATLDSSWSRPRGYKIWGDVVVRAVGDKGVIETSLFAQGVDVYGAGGHHVSGTTSDLDGLMVAEFLAAVREGRAPLTTLDDGLMASRIARAAYRSVESGKPERP